MKELFNKNQILADIGYDRIQDMRSQLDKLGQQEKPLREEENELTKKSHSDWPYTNAVFFSIWIIGSIATFDTEWFALFAFPIFPGIITAFIYFIFLIFGLAERLSEPEKQRLEKVNSEIKELSNKRWDIRKLVQQKVNLALEEYKDLYLYRKRSDNPYFHEAFAEYEQAIEYLDNDFTVSEHKQYLDSRKYTIPRGAYQARQKITIPNPRKSTPSNYSNVTQTQSVFPENNDISNVQTPLTVPEQKIDALAHNNKMHSKRSEGDVDEISLDKLRFNIGNTAEEAVVVFEKEELQSKGLEELSRKVAHASKEQGDGLGYDVLSYHSDGTKKYIEVKGTKSTSHTSNFTFTRNEIAFLDQNRQSAYVYCVFGVATNPRLKIYPADLIVSTERQVTAFNVKLK